MPSSQLCASQGVTNTGGVAGAAGSPRPMPAPCGDCSITPRSGQSSPSPSGLCEAPPSSGPQEGQLALGGGWGGMREAMPSCP